MRAIQLAGEEASRTNVDNSCRAGAAALSGATGLGRFHEAGFSMKEDGAYRRFTGKAELEKIFNTLIGLIEGIVIDAKINDVELGFLQSWLDAQRARAQRHPFNEIVPLLDQAIADGVLSSGGKEDILWLCRRLTANTYLSMADADMQRLQSLVAAISSDGQVSVDELCGLADWLLENEHLKTCWPYDEIESLVSGVLEDGKIDPAEHAMLMAYFGEFLAAVDSKVEARRDAREGATVVGLCAVDPAIRFPGSVFCMTGSSGRYSRQEFAVTIAGRGGKAVNAVSKSVHYLVIGAGGNPCWAYACYGRKVERAVELRKEGHPIVIVHETDFHEAVLGA